MRIAVEDGLSHIREALQAEVYVVTKLSPGRMEGVSAAVVTGLSNNFMGIHDTNGNRFPVIDATGMTVDEVIRQVKERALH